MADFLKQLTEGYLWQNGSFKDQKPGSWDKSWYVIQENSLSSYKKKDAKQFKTGIDLTDAVAVKSAPQFSTKKRFVFSLSTKLKTHYFYTTADSLRANWVTALENKILKQKEPQRPAPSAPAAPVLNQSGKSNTTTTSGAPEGGADRSVQTDSLGPSSETPLPEGAAVLFQVIALFDCEAEEEGDLSFNAGDIIDILAMDEGWWTGALRGTIGILPSNYVEVIEPATLQRLMGQAEENQAANGEASSAQESAAPKEDEASKQEAPKEGEESTPSKTEEPVVQENKEEEASPEKENETREVETEKQPEPELQIAEPSAVPLENNKEDKVLPHEPSPVAIPSLTTNLEDLQHPTQTEETAPMQVDQDVKEAEAQEKEQEKEQEEEKEEQKENIEQEQQQDKKLEQPAEEPMIEDKAEEVPTSELPEPVKPAQDQDETKLESHEQEPSQEEHLSQPQSEPDAKPEPEAEAEPEPEPESEAEPEPTPEQDDSKAKEEDDKVEPQEETENEKNVQQNQSEQVSPPLSPTHQQDVQKQEEEQGIAEDNNNLTQEKQIPSETPQEQVQDQQHEPETEPKHQSPLAVEDDAPVEEKSHSTEPEEEPEEEPSQDDNSDPKPSEANEPQQEGSAPVNPDDPSSSSSATSQTPTQQQPQEKFVEVPVLFHVEVAFDFVAENETEISVKKGVLLSVLEQDQGWFKCQSDTRCGFVPASYVRNISPEDFLARKAAAVQTPLTREEELNQVSQKTSSLRDKWKNLEQQQQSQQQQTIIKGNPAARNRIKELLEKSAENQSSGSSSSSGSAPVQRSGNNLRAQWENRIREAQLASSSPSKPARRPTGAFSEGGESQPSSTSSSSSSTTNNTGSSTSTGSPAPSKLSSDKKALVAGLFAGKAPPPVVCKEPSVTTSSPTPGVPKSTAKKSGFALYGALPPPGPPPPVAPTPAPAPAAELSASDSLEAAEQELLAAQQRVAQLRQQRGETSSPSSPATPAAEPSAASSSSPAQTYNVSDKKGKKKDKKDEKKEKDEKDKKKEKKGFFRLSRRF